MADMVDENAIVEALERYRKALLMADKAQLDALCADEMTYGHSSGLTQTKSEFVADATSGKTAWISIGFEEQRSRVVGGAAVSRYVFVGESQSGGKVNALRFGAVMVWQMQGGYWKLLVRQGYKL